MAQKEEADEVRGKFCSMLCPRIMHAHVWVGGGLACLKLVVPIGLRLITLVLSLNAFPMEAVVPIGLSQPGALNLPVLRIFMSLHSLVFHW